MRTTFQVARPDWRFVTQHMGWAWLMILLQACVAPSSDEALTKVGPDDARAHPAVRNGLLREAQVAYLMAWRNALNADSQPSRRGVYLGMGPDISTPLVLTDFDTLFSVDIVSPTTQELRELKAVLLEDADGLFKAGIPGLDGAEAAAYRRRTHRPNSVNYREQLTAHVARRRDNGFWVSGGFSHFGITRLLGIELDRLEVDPRSLDISEQPCGTTLTFRWPGRWGQKRTIHFVNTGAENVDAIIRALRRCANPVQRFRDSWRADVLYTKSIPRSESATSIPGLAAAVKPRGAVVSGTDISGERVTVGTEFEGTWLALPDGIEQRFAQAMADAPRYGWQLAAMRLRPSSR